MRLITGLILGIVITISVYEFNTDQIDLKTIPDLPKTPDLVDLAALEAVKDELEYQFYDALEFSTVLLDTKPYQDVALKAKTYEYFVQLGSFSDKNNADAFRAELLLEGYLKPDLFIEREDKKPYRVMIGPFAEEGLAYDTEQWAAAHKLNALLVKRPQ